MTYSGFSKLQEEEIRRLARIEAQRMIRLWVKRLAESQERKHARIEKALESDDDGDWDI